MYPESTMGLQSMLPQFKQVVNRLDSLDTYLGAAETQTQVTSKWDTKLSHAISKLLRHDTACVTAGHGGKIPMDAGGRVRVDWLAEQLKCQKAEIERVVGMQDSANMRFALEKREDGDLIFCFQGHDLSFYMEQGGPIDLNVIYRRIEAAYEAIHSTKSEYVSSILAVGLKFLLPQEFQHARKKQDASRFVHMWNRVNSAKKGRAGATAWIRVDMEKAMRRGIPFYEAGNGVILASNEIPPDCLSDMTSEMVQEIDCGAAAFLEDSDAKSGYVSWKSVLMEDDAKLKLRFVNDLWKGAQSGIHGAVVLLDVLKKGLKNNVPNDESFRKYMEGREGYKASLTFSVYECVNLSGVYMVMVNGRSDHELEALAKLIGFPRGLPVLWKPGEFIDIRGFHPKFPNDSRNNQVFNPDLLNGADTIRFFLKWSGFLLHVFAFKYQGAYYWTVCTKKVAFKNGVPFFEWGRSLLDEYMQDETLIKKLADDKIYIGAEALCVDDVHGYIVKRNDFVVTCVSRGSYVDLTAGSHHVDRTAANGNAKLVVYDSVEDIVRFCSSHGLPYDTGYTIKSKQDRTTDADSTLKTFAAELFAERDVMKCTDFRTRIESLGQKYKDTIEIIRLQGSKSHEEIVGENLEGFVLNISSSGGLVGTKTYKVKLPYYTWRTFFLREWLETVYATDNVEGTDDLFSFVNSTVPEVELVTQSMASAIQEYLSTWCCTPHGRHYFEKLCRCAVMALKTRVVEVVANSRYPIANFSTSSKFKNRLHVLLADYVEGLSIDSIDQASSEFRVLAVQKNIKLLSFIPTVYVCVGPVGYGKSISTSKLASLCKDFPVDLIDGDMLAGSSSWTYALGEERNPMTLGAIWKSLMAGRIPLLSVGGGQICEFRRESVECNLKKYALEVFGCHINFVAAVMIDVSETGRTHVENITSLKSDDKLRTLVDEIYKVPERYTAKVVADRVKRGDVPADTPGADVRNMHAISTGNRSSAFAILNAADHVFSIPCRCADEDPQKFINEEIRGWAQILKAFTEPHEIDGNFSQLRAVVFQCKRSTTKVDIEGKGCHLTIYFKSRGEAALNLSSSQIRSLDSRIESLGKIIGTKCKMVLSKIPSGVLTEKRDIRNLSEFMTLNAEPLPSGTQMTSFEKRKESKDSFSQAHADADVASWSDDEVMGYKLTSEMYSSPSFIFCEEAAIYNRKKEMSQRMNSIINSAKTNGYIEAAYIPCFNNLMLQSDRLAHATISSKHIEDKYSDLMIRWFLSELPKPESLTLGAGDTLYQFSNPRPTKLCTVLVNDKNVTFHSRDNGKFKAGDLLEKEVNIEGNCFLDNDDTEFIYVGLVPIK